MSTNTNAIALESEIASKVGSSVSTVANKCCTKDRAITIGAEVASGYSSNQLIKYSDAYVPSVALSVYVKGGILDVTPVGPIELQYGFDGNTNFSTSMINGKQYLDTTHAVTKGLPFTLTIGTVDFTSGGESSNTNITVNIGSSSGGSDYGSKMVRNTIPGSFDFNFSSSSITPTASMSIYISIE